MTNESRWFRVRFGYAKGEFVSIPETKLATAIYAKQTGSSFAYGNVFLDGREIKNITPDYHKHTGWNDDYDPHNTQDMLEIKRYCPNYDGVMDAATELAIRAGRDNNTLILKEFAYLPFPVHTPILRI